MARGALGYLHRLTGARRVARLGMAVSVALALAGLATLLLAGWSAGDALALAGVLLVAGCLGSCVAVWRIDAGAARDLDQEIAALARRRRAHESRYEQDGG